MAGGPGHKTDEEGPKDPMVRFYSYLHGGTANLISALPTIIVFPIYKTVFRQQLHNSPVKEAVSQLYKEGPKKLYRGVVPPLLMRALNGTLLFGLQDTLHLQLSRPFKNVLSAPALHAVAGIGAGVVEAMVFTPFERIQNILQNGQNDRQLPTMKSVLLRLKSERLAVGFYRGFLPILARNALGSSLYFGLKGPVRAVLEEQGVTPMISSFISGTLPIGLVLYPLHVLVTHMQAQVGGDNRGVMACWMTLWTSRQRSVIQLYRGGSLVILRSCITWGIATAIYDRQQAHSG